MRKTLLLLATTALIATPLTAAQAAGSYKVSASVSDNKLDLTSGDGTNRSTHIRGKVTGGPVSGKKVYLYASNESATTSKYVYIGSDRLSSSGKFDKVWKPKEGGSYKIKVLKKAGSGKKEGFDYTRVQVFNFSNLARFYHDGNDNLPEGTDLVRRVDKDGKVGSAYWSTAYEIRGNASAVFDTSGYKCFRINFKVGVSNASADGEHKVRISQGSTTIVSKTMERGDTYVEPTRTQSERMNATDPVRVTVTADTDLGDPSAARFILGNPKAACTYPEKNDPENQPN